MAYMVVTEEAEKLVRFTELSDDHFLDHVVGKIDYFESFDVTKVQRGDVALLQPLLGALVAFLLQDTNALIYNSFSGLLLIHVIITLSLADIARSQFQGGINLMGLIVISYD